MTTLMIIEQSANVPEKMRVEQQDDLFLVQNFSEFNDSWITQVYYHDAIEAMKDCFNWYISIQQDIED